MHHGRGLLCSRLVHGLGAPYGAHSSYTDSYEASEIFSDPEFANYTAVYAMYCDGGSWTGNVAVPVKIAGIARFTTGDGPSWTR